MDYVLAIEIIIWLSIISILYIFLFYPVFLWVASKLFYKPVNASAEFQPEITLIIAAHNEEQLIEDAVISVFESGYPNEKLHVIVGSDGSTDGTVNILKSLKVKYPTLEYYELERSGKNGALNKLVPLAKTDLIFFLDADLRILPGMLNTIVGKFADPTVGCVLSSLRIVGENDNDNAGRQGETLYQYYESFIRIFESKIYSTVNSMGTLYGIRKENYNPLPNNRVADDLFTVLNASLYRKRVIFDTDCIVHEVRQKSLTDEMLRRVRLVAGGLSAVWEVRPLLFPKYGWVSMFLWCHKVFRWFIPYYLIAIIIGTALLPTNNYLWLPLITVQTVLYVSALLGWFFEKLNFKIFPFRLALFFVSMNIGFLLGMLRFLRSKENATWQRVKSI